MAATLSPNSKKPYQRLPGKKKGFLVGTYHLWLGPDHLLQIYSRFGMEDYKRFYFADIQSMAVRKTVAGRIVNIILAIMLGLLLLTTAMVEGAWQIFFGSIAVLTGLLLLINWLRGPTCRTQLKTAVQTETLYSLHRIKTAMKVLDRLSPITIQTQGTVQPKLAFQKITAQPSRIPVAARRRPTGRHTVPQPLKREKGLAHTVLFMMLLIDGTIVILNASLHMMALTLISVGASIVILVALVIALVRQDRSDMRQPLKRMTWAALGFLIASFGFGYFINMVNAFQNPAIMQNQWHMLQYYTDISPFASPMMAISFVLTVGGAVFIGLPGLYLLNQHQKIRSNSMNTPNEDHTPSASAPV